MRVSVRIVLLSLVVLAMAADTHAQAPPTADGVSGTPAKAAALAQPAGLDQPVATVNGEAITKGDLLDFLSRYQIPPGNDQQVYRDAVETLINTRLVSQHLDRLRIPVPEERVNEAVAEIEKQLKADGRTLKEALAISGRTEDEVRRELATRQRWVEFVKMKATDAELKKFADSHKDLLNGTQVKASHILLRVAPDAPPAEKQKVREKLLGIKRDIEANTMTFAQAANKYSEDPANSEGAGGDIGYFTLASGVVEEFADAAFKLKKGEISDPVETVYGEHLIQVTDRKDGGPIDFEANKPAILNAFAAELQKGLLIAERKTAKIDGKPMPPDLFPPAPAATPGAGPAPAPGGNPATPKS
jgi:peptidyl-prolyl cis-trans isomerase C